MTGRLTTRLTVSATLSLELLYFGLDGSVGSKCDINCERMVTFSYQSGFNGGSALAANLRAAQACIVTNLSASASGLTWMLWVSSGIFTYAASHWASLFPSFQEYRDVKKWSAVAFCSGAIAGLIAITPAAGFVGSRAFRLPV